MERDRLKDLDVDGKILFKWSFKKCGGRGRGDIDWINLGLERDRRWAVMNWVVNLRVP